MIYLDSISLGLEFHLGKSTQDTLKPVVQNPHPFALTRPKAVSEYSDWQQEARDSMDTGVGFLKNLVWGGETNV